MRVFVDSSVLFAMCFSRTGAARELIKLAFRRRIQLVVSDYVFEETEANLREKSPRSLTLFRFFRQHRIWQVVNPKRDDVRAAIGVTTDDFDAPIVAAAKLAGVDRLVSFDRKHLHTAKVSAYIGCEVSTPADVVKLLRSE